MDLNVVFAGTAASAPTASRGVAALVVRRGGDTLLFDCGEGTQRQLIRSIGLADLEHVFITHFHADHILGLPGMFKTFALRGRDLPLTVYGPRGLAGMMRDLEPLYGRLPYELTIRELAPAEPVAFKDYEVTPFSVDHQGNCFGYAVVEDVRPGRFDLDAAKRLGVRPGPDFNTLQHGGSVTAADGTTVTADQVLGEARLGRKVVYSGDTAPCETLKIAAYRADLLVHESSFGDEESDRAAETRHSTARQAARIARDAEVMMLCLNHVSSRYFGRELRDQAREVFENTEMPRDFDSVEIPFPERGEPRFVKYRRPQNGIAEADGQPAGGDSEDTNTDAQPTC
ncbi:MAG: ribonuclease Z [Actinobacteria bacterium]|nr:ribonuclease Z [Actinomycetota bacterium]